MFDSANSTVDDFSVGQGADRLVGSDRVLAVLSELARHPDGIGLDEMTRAIDSPKSTVHRALASLRKAGFADQDRRGRYLLGDELLRMAFANHESRPEHIRVQSRLALLSELFNETVHYAVLDGAWIVYRSKVDPPAGAVKLSSTIGGRNPAHSTAVGKLLLAYALADDAAVRAWARDNGLPRRTENTITAVEAFITELAAIRAQGYSVDDQENETGVNCLAVPAFLASPSTPSGAISVSGLTYRTPLATLVDAVVEIAAIATDPTSITTPTS